MKSYQADVVIDAPLSTVWAILTDGDSYPQWASGISRIEGTIAEGSRITVHSDAGRAFRVQVTLSADLRVMRWIGGLPLGLFRGVRVFTLEAADEGGTHLLVREDFTGPLQPLIVRSMPDLQPSFDAFVVGVKARAESVV